MLVGYARSMANDDASTDTQQRSSALADLASRFPPWLPPLLFVMAAAIGVGGFEIMLLDRGASSDSTCDCDELRAEVATLERVVRSLLDEADARTSEQPRE